MFFMFVYFGRRYWFVYVLNKIIESWELKCIYWIFIGFFNFYGCSRIKLFNFIIINNIEGMKFLDVYVVYVYLEIN